MKTFQCLFHAFILLFYQSIFFLRHNCLSLETFRFVQASLDPSLEQLYEKMDFDLKLLVLLLNYYHYYHSNNKKTWLKRICTTTGQKK